MKRLLGRLIGRSPEVASPRSRRGSPATGRHPPTRRRGEGRAHHRRSLGPVEPMRVIEEARERASLTHYGLAKLAGMDQTYLRRLLNGQRRSPSRDTLIALGEALMQFDGRFKRKDLDKVLRTAGLLKLPNDWSPRMPVARYNPRARVRSGR